MRMIGMIFIVCAMLGCIAAIVSSGSARHVVERVEFHK